MRVADHSAAYWKGCSCVVEEAELATDMKLSRVSSACLTSRRRSTFAFATTASSTHGDDVAQWQWRGDGGEVDVNDRAVDQRHRDRAIRQDHAAPGDRRDPLTHKKAASETQLAARRGTR